MTDQPPGVRELPVRADLDRAALLHLARALKVSPADLTDAQLRDSIRRAQHLLLAPPPEAASSESARHVTTADRAGLVHAAAAATGAPPSTPLLTIATAHLERLLTEAETWHPVRLDRPSGTPLVWHTGRARTVRLIHRTSLYEQAVHAALDRNGDSGDSATTRPWLLALLGRRRHRADRGESSGGVRRCGTESFRAPLLNGP